jgi:hypothetical protein
MSLPSDLRDISGPKLGLTCELQCLHTDAIFPNPEKMKGRGLARGNH